MHVIKRKTLVDYYEKHAIVKADLEAWYNEAKKAHWKTSQDIKDHFSSASFLCDNRVVFNIHGNAYRLLTRINYDSETVFILFIGTHAEYSKYDMEIM